MGTLTKYFDVEEMTPRGGIGQSQLDPKLLELLDQVRELLGVPCTINNWHTGGTREWCGWRSDACTIGAPHSYHRKGMAADLHPVGMSAEDARTLIHKAVAEGGLPYLGAVELDVSWCHIDTRPRVDGKVLWFRG